MAKDWGLSGGADCVCLKVFLVFLGKNETFFAKTPHFSLGTRPFLGHPHTFFPRAFSTARSALAARLLGRRMRSAGGKELTPRSRPPGLVTSQP